MKPPEFLLAVASIVLAALGACSTLALVGSHIVIPQALWLGAPYLALGLIGFYSRREATSATITLVGTTVLVVGGYYLLERTRAVALVPAVLLGGCALLLLILFGRWPRQ